MWIERCVYKLYISHMLYALELKVACVEYVKCTKIKDNVQV
jgi:hypothetical protein